MQNREKRMNRTVKSEAVENGNESLLWQLPIIGSFKSMSYCIRTADNMSFVIDGGDLAEADYLADFIRTNLDGHVDAWFITHPHKAHAGAFIKILNEQSIPVKRIIYPYMDPEIVARYEQSRVQEIVDFNAAVKLSKIPSDRVRNGDRLKLGKSIVKVIAATDVETARNYVNNRGMIYKFNFKTSTVLFLGDIGYEAGLSLLSSFKDELKSDIVQMSHHGYYGVSKELYAVIAPSICLWPTRREIWPVTSRLLTGEGKDISTTYEYMRSIGVIEHHVAGVEGLCVLKL